MDLDAKLPLQSSNIANTKLSKTIEETYQKKTQLEHILLRPDTYIGSIEQHTQRLWVLEGDEMVHREIKYVPGLYKIFDEILVNAADNKQRDPSMDCVKVVIDPEQNLISVYNNGDGVPVEIHKEEGVYVPELIFGHLLTSSNYDDNVKKTTGGRNGYGAKLSNIFSTEFVIETADGKRQKKYKQVFSNNMGKRSEPVITKCKEKENWTKVTFKPDLAKFNMTYLEDDVVALMKKRVYDLAGCLGKTVKVELNGKRVSVKSFEEYVDLYLKAAAKNEAEKLPRIMQKVNPRWEVGVSLSDGQFQQVSFVNGIATIKGGTHVDYVTNQICNYVANVVNKKNKTANVKAHNVKNHLWVFVNALIDNPAFDSQTKETLTLRQSSFGSKCELQEDFLKKVASSGVVKNLLYWVDLKNKKDLKKTDGTKSGSIHGIPNLEDANEAGTRYSEKCTLILTEGLSAKSLAVAGLSVVGRDYYGVFPLKGKLLNVREASHKQLMDNAEIQNIKRILGLQQGKEYTDVKSLRYGHLMIMTDQDHDGSHIKGLLINFIHSFWPSLLRVPTFMVEFITPIVKAKKGGNTISFYSMPEFESWKESLGANAKGWTIKYYKGLGTSTDVEAKEYFKNLDKHRKVFVWDGDQDGDAIELAFSKKKIEGRKNWLRQFEPGTHLDHKQELIKYTEFINKELILFSMADLQRSIPSMVDGLKPGQRKILFCAFKRNFVKEAKVAQFSGYVSEHSAYHHGEQSLNSTIVGMAQDFVGSNNLNLLDPIGQFGTRNQGGKDAASARYIFTKLSPITRYLFPKSDDMILEYLNEDGQSIEPTWYVPIIPMVLVNGSEGIGTGWSSYIPNYNPRDIVANVRRLLNGEQMVPMHPWYRGFNGAIEKTTSKEAGVTYSVSGIIEEVNETTLRIKELPIRRWTQDYKEFLESIIIGNDPFIKEYKQYSTIRTADFEVSLTEENMMVAKQEGLLKKFKLATTISTSNMHLFDSRGTIKKYDTPEEILEEFFHLRFEFYEKRKKILLDDLEMQLLKMENKVRFILCVVKGEIIVNNRKRADLFLELQEKGFTPFPKKNGTVEVAVAGATDDIEETEENSEVSAKGVRGTDYDYLLSMAIGTLTLEKVQELCADRDKLQKEVEDLKKATPKSLWLKDLDDLEIELDELDRGLEKAILKEKEDMANGRMKGEAGKRAQRKAPKNGRKINKKEEKSEAVTETLETEFSSAMETENIPAVVKPKGKGQGGSRKAKKVDSDDEEFIPSLAERIAKLNSSPDHSAAMETEVPQEPAGKKEPSKRAAARKKPASSLSEISESIREIDINDKDSEVTEVEAAPEAGKKGGRKPAANSKAAAKPPAAAAKKRGPAAGKQSQAQQKLLTEMLKPAEESGISPEKKVRKMRASPFNKKSSSVLGRVGNGISKELEATDSEDATIGSSTMSENSPSSEEVTEVVVPARSRPQRANRKQTTYVLSDSESDNATEDNDFDGDEDDEDF